MYLHFWMAPIETLLEGLEGIKYLSVNVTKTLASQGLKYPTCTEYSRTRADFFGRSSTEGPFFLCSGAAGLACLPFSFFFFALPSRAEEELKLSHSVCFSQA